MPPRRPAVERLVEPAVVADPQVPGVERIERDRVVVDVDVPGGRRERRPVITGLERISRPGNRVYAGKQEIPWVLSGMGVAILSTPKGVMTGQRARQLGVGGEIICKVW